LKELIIYILPVNGFSFSCSSVLIPVFIVDPSLILSSSSSPSCFIDDVCSLTRLLFFERVNEVFNDELTSSNFSTADIDVEDGGNDYVGDDDDCFNLFRFRLLLLLGFVLCNVLNK